MKEKKRTLLIVEDDPGLQSQLKWCFDDTIEVVTAENKKTALAHVRRIEPQVITLDLGLPPDPGGSTVGFDILQEATTLAPNTKIIIITGREEKENAVKAIGMGAYDFYQKPIEGDLLRFVVERAFRLHELETEISELAQSQQTSLGGIIASSEQMLMACRTIEKVAPTDLTTLILGDTGTGKELFAQALHDNSERRESSFNAINCAAIPDALLESELFGYEKGAFTGAIKQKIGKIEAANGGTLFLDEIGDMPLSLQSKLLRFLQERTIERVGGHNSIPVDIRVVCATHRNLSEMIAEASFREDLFYRISEMTINVPPLREREGDAVLLAHAFMEKYSAQHNRKLLGFTEDAISALETYRWPGNVRELENKIKRATIMAEGNKINQVDLEIKLDNSEEAEPLNLREVRDRAEKQAVMRALTNSKNNVAQAARMLGVTRPTLYNLLNKFNINID
ncbi:MAG: PEP-CTERM-box response regulator transcription factor [Pseudomonadales bacterium]|nr:PEP-CTERM-box response regulator transcription factor [Pseudomonadales bacterium]